jgi:hypothetical protein
LPPPHTGACPLLPPQLVKFAEAVPENYRAYLYAGMSLGGGVLAALVLFGWSVWAY